ncbi:LOW QUALITY PROTEIN: general odorant-binding protein 57c-like [Cochliomyia hominivorax]
MKFAVNCILFTFLVFISQKVEANFIDDMQKSREECFAELSIMESELKDPDPVSGAKDIEMKFKCLAHCVLEKMDYLDENDKLDGDKFQDLVKEHGVEGARISDCKEKHDMIENKCDYAFNVIVCIMNK